MEKFKDIHILRWEEIPDFPLYIDQVITLIEKSLSFLSEEKGEKIITSTMINLSKKDIQDLRLLILL